MVVEGDFFHRYDRFEMRALIEQRAAEGRNDFSHFGPEANLFAELEALFRVYGQSGTGKFRTYIHNEEDAQRHGVPSGKFTPWGRRAGGLDLLFYEGLHGAVVTDDG